MPDMVTDTTRTSAAGPSAGGGLTGAMVSEWTKIWSIWSTWVCLATGPALMGVFCIYYGGIAHIDNAPVQPVGNAPTTAMIVVQFAIAAFAIQVVSSEYATGSIRTTLLWVPRRGLMLLSKAIPAAAIAFVAGLVNGVLGLGVAWLSFAGNATFEAPRAIRDVLSIGVYSALIAVFAIGLTVAVRSAAAALSALFGLLAVLPSILLAASAEPMATIYEYVPTTAGLNFMQGLDELYPPVIGLLVVVVWTALAYLAGSLVLRKRDA